jgi:adenylosuccinate synthase
VPVTVVVGTQWGDEGKAKLIDQLAGEADVVVRYQGGHNAGHTVVANGRRFALQLVPSGVLHDQVVPVIGNGVVVDPAALVAEIDRLEAAGVSCARLQVSSRAHLILPWHQALDVAHEARRGEAQIGTTLKGIGPAYADKARRLGLRAGDLVDLRSYADAVAEGCRLANAELTSLGAAPLEVTEVVASAVAHGERVAPYVTDTVTWLHAAVERDAAILLEGAQATFLDLDHGTYPYVTSSNPTAGYAAVGSGIGPRHLTRIVGIAKAYCTRVGAGPFPTEAHGADGDVLVERGHEFGTVTGRRRRPGWFDAVMLRHAVRINSLTEVAITKLDVLDTFDTVRVAVGYRRNGADVTAYPDRLADLAAVEPVYRELPGWRTDLTACRRWEDLPVAAREYVALLEAEIGVPVRYVGVGPDREQVITRP